MLELEFLELEKHRFKIISGSYSCRNLRDTDLKSYLVVTLGLRFLESASRLTSEMCRQDRHSVGCGIPAQHL